MPEPTVVRTENVVVDTVGSNTYGDMVFTDKAGNEHKISNKRLAHFQMIQPNAGVTLHFALSSKGTEYVAKAVSIAGQLSPPTTPQIPADAPPQTVHKPTPAPAVKENDNMTKADWAEKDRIERASIEKQSSLGKLTELIVAGKIEQYYPSKHIEIASKVIRKLCDLAGITTKEE